MRKVILAIVVAAGAITAVATSASAQSVYFGFGDGPRYDRSYYGGGYRSYDNGYRHNRRYSYNSYASGYRTCRVKRVWVGDHYRRIRRCW